MGPSQQESKNVVRETSSARRASTREDGNQNAKEQIEVGWNCVNSGVPSFLGKIKNQVTRVLNPFRRMKLLCGGDLRIIHLTARIQRVFVSSHPGLIFLNLRSGFDAVVLKRSVHLIKVVLMVIPDDYLRPYEVDC